MDENTLIIELKDKGLPVYGSRADKIKRLKKAFNIASQPQSPSKKFYLKFRQRPRSSVVDEIDRMKKNRDERRIK